MHKLNYNKPSSNLDLISVPAAERESDRRFEIAAHSPSTRVRMRLQWLLRIAAGLVVLASIHAVSPGKDITDAIDWENLLGRANLLWTWGPTSVIHAAYTYH